MSDRSTGARRRGGRRPEAVRARRGEAGLTLIAVVVAGVAGAAVVGIFVEQSGFYQENSRRVMAHGSLRAAATSCAWRRLPGRPAGRLQVDRAQLPAGRESAADQHR